jgi:hypothetical protein
VKRSKLELACQIREPHAWTRRTGLKVPSGLGAFLQTTREGDKGSCEKEQRRRGAEGARGRRGEREKGRRGDDRIFHFLFFYLSFVISIAESRLTLNTSSTNGK